jgi:TM2 domain-containing membrane protein YozV
MEETMLRLEFEQSILEMVFEVGYRSLTPATVAYYLKIPVKRAETTLDELVLDGVLELESDEWGRYYYVLPVTAVPAPDVIAQTIERRAQRALGGERIFHPLPPQIVRHPRPYPEAVDGTIHPGSPPPTIYVDMEQVQARTDHSLVLPDDEVAVIPTSPAVPMALSLLWPGLGQIHNEQPGKGLLLFFASMFLWLEMLGWIVHVFAAIDAAVVAGQRREHTSPTTVPLPRL